MATIAKPYTNLPSYADIEYIDGKLRVATCIIHTTTNMETKKNWLETIDILLEQRFAMEEVNRGDYR